MLDFGTMWLVTYATGQATGVICTGYLRERVRLSTIGFMAACADYSSVRLLWPHRSRVISVFGLWSMAHFAVQSSMFSQLFLIDNFGVAVLANLVPCIGDRARCQLSDGVATVVPILPERFRHDRSAQDYKGDQRDEHDSC